jgi:dihydroorotase
MPNLNPPVTTSQAALAYRERIVATLTQGAEFEPLLTCYLTDNSSSDAIEEAFRERIFIAAKLYPANATTNSQHGVAEICSIQRVLERLERIGMPLLIHGESIDPKVDIFDRERVFIETILTPLLLDFPALKVVLEHITTSFAVDFVRSDSSGRLAATITPHHLLINRNAIFSGGLRPHAYCLPVAKREADRLALRRAATSGEPCFFLGTDSAPHSKRTKESDCGCAGIFCAPVALETYAQVFDEEGTLDRLEAFASEFGANFYDLPLNTGTITLRRKSHKVESARRDESDRVEAFRDGEMLEWSIDEKPEKDGSRQSGTPTHARSAASPWWEQRPPHLPCKMGDLPKAVLFPGDPARVDRFATVLTDFRIIGQNREFRIATGTFNGVELGVCSTGIGGPSTEIALVEAASLGCEFALRVGGTGALRSSIPVGTLLIVREALRGGGAASSYAIQSIPARADPRMIEALSQAAKESGVDTIPALVASTDSYYAGQDRPFPNSDPAFRTRLEAYRDRGADAVDMEAETILVVGNALGMASGVLLAVHANRSSDEWLEEFGEAQNRMITLGCDALSRLVRNSTPQEQAVRNGIEQI